MQHAYSLKNRIIDALRASKVLTYKQVENIAIDAGYKPDTATRRLRMEDDSIPCIKLNKLMKPIKNSEPWFFVKWCGGKTIIRL